MKGIAKVLIIFILVFIVLFIGKLVYDKIESDRKPKEPVEYKLSKNISFSSNDIELILNSDGTYFMYKKDNINSGTFKILDNNIIFVENKKYLKTCYNSIDETTTSYLVVFNKNKELSQININDKTLNIVDNNSLVNISKTSFSDIDCSSKIKKYQNEKFEHDITIENKKINYESSISEEDKNDINEFLYEFYDRYYEIISKLEYKDISDMFVNEENAYIYKTALELLVENRKSNENDLTILNPKYELTIKNYKKSGNEVSFIALENCSYNFSFIKQYTSSVYNIENKFTLTKVDGKYKIKNYKKSQDFYVMITDVYSKTNDYKNKLDSIKNNYLNKFKTYNNKFAKMKEDYLSNNYKTLKCDHGYDREKSYEYATKYVGRRNEDKWETHGSANCVNFVSQVMNIGGIPMDNKGTATWYNYNKGKSETFSWINVGGIKEYFKNNTGFGLCGKYDENIYLGDTGDVVTVGSTGDGRHAITVIRPIQDEEGNTIDLLVSSNTVDLIYFPLSAYAYPYKTLLKVYGYND